MVDLGCEYNSGSESENSESRLVVKIATTFMVVFGCLVYLAQPVLAIGYFPADAAAIELLWQGHVAKSPEINAAILSMSEEAKAVTTKARLEKENLSKFEILPFLGIKVGITSSRNLANSNITDFPGIVLGASTTTARQWADMKCRGLLAKHAGTIISDWHEYEVLVLRKTESKSDKERLEELRASLISVCGGESLRQAEVKMLLYGPIELDLIIKSKPGEFPYYSG